MSASARVILAVDCGSTSFKAALFSSRLERLGEATGPVPYARHDATCVEMPGEGLWQAFADVVSGACRSAGLPSRRVDRIAFASQAQTFALCDPACRPLTPFFSWLDRRAEAEAAEAAAAFGADFHRHCSFAPPIPQLQLCKMRWLSRAHPDVLSPPAALALLPGFLAWRLGVANTVDRNLAAMGGAYSLVCGAWWPAALDFCGFANVSMPRLVDLGATVAAEAAPWSDAYRAGLGVTFAGNDQTAGAYGNGCEHGGIVVTLGTALVVYRHAGDRPGPYHPGGCWGPYPRGSFYELATIDEGCKALDWARASLLPGQPAAAFDALASRTVAAAAEDRAPRFHPGRIAAGTPWAGAREESAGAAYAVLEGICFALRRLLDGALCADGRARRIAVIGGGSRSDLWLGLLANVLGTPVTRGAGDALLGAAAMSLGMPVPEAQAAGAVWRPEPQRLPVLEARYRQWLGEA
jgi:xylulokinase